MSRFLFTMMFTNDLGLPNRTVPIALELQKKGHEVAFCNHEPAPAKLLAEAGLENLGFRERGDLTVIPDLAQPWNMDHFYCFYGCMDEAFLRNECEGMMEVIKAYSPDIIVDTWGLPGCLAARALGKPLVSIIQADMHPQGQDLIWWKDPPEDLPTCVPVVNRVMSDYGLAPIYRTDELHVGDLTLIAGIPETDPLSPGTDAIYVGPILYQKPGAKLPESILNLETDKPVLWVYTATPRYFEPFITMGDSAVIMKACIETFAHKDVQVVLTTGYRDLPSDTTSFPANFIYETFVPGLLMAERSDAIVHHGGHGASMTGPYTGTPAVVIPTFSERESNARRIADLGVAELIVPTEDEDLEKHVSVDEVWSKVKKVLSDPSYTENARQVGKRMRGYGGVNEAVRLIEDFAGQVS